MSAKTELLSKLVNHENRPGDETIFPATTLLAERSPENVSCTPKLWFDIFVKLDTN